MPDLATRTDREKELSALLLYLLQQEENRVRRGVYNVAELERDLRNGTIQPLAAIYLEAAEQLQRELNQPFNRPQWEAESLRWAAAYSRQLASEISGHTRSGVSDAVQKARETGVAAEEFWIGLFSQVRAENIGITETTRAITSGERSAAGRFLRSPGRTLTGPQTLLIVWNTERDGKVCPVCRPLDKQEEAIWTHTSPAGPPAHPRCRCWLSYEVIK